MGRFLKMNLRKNKGRGRTERGAAIVEYSAMMAVASVTLLFGVQELEDTSQQVMAATTEDLAIDELQPEEPEKKSLCPTYWVLIDNDLLKKMGHDVDANGDGMICVKEIPSENGLGNTDLNSNVKDNQKAKKDK